MSEIRKIPKSRRQEKVEPKIVGARPISAGREEPKVLDQRTRSQPVQIESREHGEIVTVSSHTRSKPKRKDEPEVRLRLMTPEAKQAWDDVKSNQWEDA